MEQKLEWTELPFKEWPKWAVEVCNEHARFDFDEEEPDYRLFLVDEQTSRKYYVMLKEEDNFLRYWGEFTFEGELSSWRDYFTVTYEDRQICLSPRSKYTTRIYQDLCGKIIRYEVDPNKNEFLLKLAYLRSY